MSPDPVRDKNFWLLSSMERDPAVKSALAAEPSFRALLTAKAEALQNADKACPAAGVTGASGFAECYASSAMWSASEIGKAGATLKALYASKVSVRAFVDGPLRRSGMYQRYSAKAGAELLVAAWEDCAKGVNRLLDFYALGKPPRYAAIDSAVYDVKSPAFARMIQSVAAMVVVDDLPQAKLFFQPTLDFALQVMRLHRRDEAGRHEPMELGENRAAVQRIRTIAWAKYPWTVIVVPGSGTDNVSIRMSPAGRLRCEMAAKRYHAGRAPLILVSGGYVHPNQTPWAEAIEMKRLLMAEFRVPESAILIDPHARHTTTNLRNAARLMYRYGVPFDRPALVTTDQSQSLGIESQQGAERCIREMGYMPIRIVKRISRFDLEVFPLIDSLYADNVEPLDP